MNSNILEPVNIHRTIGPKGQIVLPKDIRKHFNLRTGSEITFIVQDHHIILQPTIDPATYVKQFCTLLKQAKKLTMKDIKQAIEEEYEERLGKP